MKETIKFLQINGAILVPEDTEIRLHFAIIITGFGKIPLFPTIQQADSLSPLAQTAPDPAPPGY